MDINVWPIQKNLKKQYLTAKGLSPYTGKWGRNQQIHLLKRTLFGVKLSELEMFSNLSLSETLDKLLRASPSNPPVNDYSTYDDPDPNCEMGDEWAFKAKSDLYDDTLPDEKRHYNEKRRQKSLSVWLLNNIVKQEPTIHEKMSLFWHHLVPTGQSEVFSAKAMYQYFETIRLNALGNYKTIIKKLTLDPSMLFFLGGGMSFKEAPDENYARELQELFTVGKGPDSHYTESDVRAAARVLTGYTINLRLFEQAGRYETFFVPERHDTGDKQFSEFYGNRMIKGRSGEAGQEELDDLLDMIFDNRETSMYICRRIYSFFVNSTFSEKVEENVIKPMAKILRDNNFEIRPVLYALFSSEHFYESSIQGSMIKSPLDLLFGFWRTVEVDHLDPKSPHLTFLTLYTIYDNYSRRVGMKYGDPRNVSGWPAYYQTPAYDRLWLSATSVSIRARYIDYLIKGNLPINDTDYTIGADWIKFIEGLSNPSDPNDLLRDSGLLLLGLELDLYTMRELESFLSPSSGLEWSMLWKRYQKNQEDLAIKELIQSRLEETFLNISRVPSFNLM